MQLTLKTKPKEPWGPQAVKTLYISWKLILSYFFWMSGLQKNETVKFNNSKPAKWFIKELTNRKEQITITTLIIFLANFQFTQHKPSLKSLNKPWTASGLELPDVQILQTLHIQTVLHLVSSNTMLNPGVHLHPKKAFIVHLWPLENKMWVLTNLLPTEN